MAGSEKGIIVPSRRPDSAFGDRDDATEGWSQLSVVELVEEMILRAARERATDIHIDPMETKSRVRFRVDGLLRDEQLLPKGLHGQVVSRIKVLAGMDIARRRIAQDGRIQVTMPDKQIDLRVSTLPTLFGERCALRMLDKKQAPLNLDQLGFLPDALAAFQALMGNAYGMILVTGPTGAGKTTTLYAAVNAVKSPEKNIITIEDPVEYILSGINQVQVNAKSGIDFTEGLRAILRHDPDVILIGEIRDKETADIAVKAATTGHLVFSTLHTGDAAEAAGRLIDMGVEPFLVASAVSGIVAQRLVRRICRSCKTSYHPPRSSPERIFLEKAGMQTDILYRGAGCNRCNQTGFDGRLAIHEVMVVRSSLRELIIAKASTEAIRAKAVEAGMIGLVADGLAKAILGETTVQEVMRVAFRMDG
ncbi:type ii/iv secretion protein [Heliomicrobium modesticaldum Ice1]|uniref:Type ii/iv secretion protein n=2 Tax=Heliomicrobium modesticaldum TaxID=35701 RepID=B0TEF8_HELMI|nr:type ii/iv secretion protein [Heliomicrobium modesticaldum Ice1]